MKSLLIGLLVFVGFGALASGTLSLKGQVQTFSSEKIEIVDGFHKYVIERKKLSTAEEEKLKKMKLVKGSPVEMTIPFTAIESTTTIDK